MFLYIIYDCHVVVAVGFTMSHSIRFKLNIFLTDFLKEGSALYTAHNHGSVPTLFFGAYI